MYNWLFMTWPQYGRTYDDKRNSDLPIKVKYIVYIHFKLIFTIRNITCESKHLITGEDLHGQVEEKYLKN